MSATRRRPSQARPGALAVVALAALALTGPAPARAQVTSELDAYWSEISRTVADGDFEGYANLYHPDAVLVLDGSGTHPIAVALAGWKQGFDDTRAGRAKAGVTFRFTERLHDETTAHETGIFRYTLRSAEQDAVALVHFSALLVKKNGEWRMVMERQKGPATEEEWAAAGS
jgi:ketosteroid isomerase-like protein